VPRYTPGQRLDHSGSAPTAAAAVAFTRASAVSIAARASASPVSALRGRKSGSLTTMATRAKGTAPAAGPSYPAGGRVARPPEGEHGQPRGASELHDTVLRAVTRAARTVGGRSRYPHHARAPREAAETSEPAARGRAAHRPDPEPAHRPRRDLGVPVPAEHDVHASRPAEARRHERHERDRVVPEGDDHPFARACRPNMSAGSM